MPPASPLGRGDTLQGDPDQPHTYLPPTSAKASPLRSTPMLTVTLRGLERDGLVTRTVHPTVPPRVEYALTPMGHTLLATACTLVQWADDHLPEIDTARAAYDRRAALLDATLNGDPEPSRAR